MLHEIRKALGEAHFEFQKQSGAEMRWQTIYSPFGTGSGARDAYLDFLAKAATAVAQTETERLRAALVDALAFLLDVGIALPFTKKQDAIRKIREALEAKP
jgi:hypothetical protein